MLFASLFCCALSLLAGYLMGAWVQRLLHRTYEAIQFTGFCTLVETWTHAGHATRINASRLVYLTPIGPRTYAVNDTFNDELTKEAE